MKSSKLGALLGALLQLSYAVTPIYVGAAVAVPTTAEAGIVRKAVTAATVAFIGQMVKTYLKRNSLKLAEIAKNKLVDHIRRHPEHLGKAKEIIRDFVAKEAPRDSRIHRFADALKDELFDEAKSVLFDRYLDDIQKCTGLRIGKEQKNLLRDAMRSNKLNKVDRKDYRKVADEFEKASNKEAFRKEWSAKTGMPWPTNPQSLNSSVVAGNPHQMHHVIEKDRGGGNEWWNFHPAMGGSRADGGQHQGCIHHSTGVLNDMYDILGVK